MPRLVYLAGVGIALVALAFVMTEAALGPPPGVTEANVRRIKVGMTFSGVETVFGKGADEYEGNEGWGSAIWYGEAGDAFIEFSDHDANGKPLAAAAASGEQVVTSATFVRRRASTPDPLARLRAWLGW